jgi:hypothetical protein
MSARTPKKLFVVRLPWPVAAQEQASHWFTLHVRLPLARFSPYMLPEKTN